MVKKNDHPYVVNIKKRLQSDARLYPVTSSLKQCSCGLDSFLDKLSVFCRGLDISPKSVSQCNIGSSQCLQGES